jgi:hypothetical protein
LEKLVAQENETKIFPAEDFRLLGQLRKLYREFGFEESIGPIELQHSVYENQVLLGV